MPPFRPFKPGEFVQNPDGTVSTERTITWQTPEGKWVNTPTLFMNNRGEVIDLSTPDKYDQAVSAAMALIRSGYEFPTYEDEGSAVTSAQGRSKGGGAFQGGLGHASPPKPFLSPPAAPVVPGLGNMSDMVARALMQPRKK
jgi:hypothetical protein